MLTIQRGSTPTIKATIPEDIDMASASVIWFSISQAGAVVIDKTTDDIEVDGQEVTVSLTQAETLALMENVRGKAQIRLLMNDGTALPSRIRDVIVYGLVKDGVIG